MKCKHCGAKIAADSKYCEFCGAKLHHPSKKGRKILFWAILSIAIIVLIGLLTKWVNEWSNVGSGAEAFVENEDDTTRLMTVHYTAPQ